MKIVYFKIRESAFILRDQEILERHFQTRSYLIDTRSQTSYFVALLRLLCFLLFSGRRYDAYFIRFADWHTALLAFFKKLYRKKLFIVVGGYDVAAIERFNYGAHRNRLQSRFIRYSLNHATCLLPNSESMIYYENRLVQEGVVYGGIRYFAPRTRSQIRVVPNGFDSQLFHRLPGIEKRNLAITVAVVEREKNYFMKGIDRFILTARELPSFEFLIVGISGELLEQMETDLPANLGILGVTGTGELIRLYSEATVFCLFSLSEGMPNTLCEAMLCECIPVGTEVTSIPEIIGETGFVVHTGDQKEYTEKVRLAFNAGRQMGLAARQRIATSYDMGLRESKLVSILSET